VARTALRDTGCKNRNWMELRIVSNAGSYGIRGAISPGSDTMVLRVDKTRNILSSFNINCLETMKKD
jgi:hypothetical protein